MFFVKNPNGIDGTFGVLPILGLARGNNISGIIPRSF
jgi:hypothetical protein